MKPWNPYAMTFHGQPIAGQTPPKVIVRGPPMTAQQGAMLQSAYTSFQDAARTSIAPNPSRHGFLPDGSAYVIQCVNGVCTCIVQTAPGGNEFGAGGGGIVIFYRGKGFYRIWYEGSQWRSQHVKRACCGVNIQVSPGGLYFCDNASTWGVEGPQPTRLRDLTRDEQRGVEDGVSAKRGGYFFECDPPGDMNYAVQTSPGEFTYLSVTGSAYNILAGSKKNPSEKTDVVKNIISSGALNSAGLNPITQKLARRHEGNFLVIATSLDPHEDENGFDIRRWIREATYPTIKNFDDGTAVPSKYMRVLTVVSSEPYAVTEAKIDIIQPGRNETDYRTRRIPTEYEEVERLVRKIVIDLSPTSEWDTTTYIGFPLEGKIEGGVMLKQTNGYEHKLTHESEETRWMREIVDFAGERYSLNVLTENKIENSISYKEIDNYFELLFGYHSGSWRTFALSMPQDYGYIHAMFPTRDLTNWGNEKTWPNVHTTEYVNMWENALNIHTKLSAGRYDVPLLDIDIRVVETRRVVEGAYDNPDKTKIGVLSNTYTIEVHDKVFLRVLQAFEEKTYTAVLTEVEYIECKVENESLDNRGRFKAKKRKRIVVFSKGERVFHGEWSETSHIDYYWDRSAITEYQVPAEIVGIKVINTEGTYPTWRHTHEHVCESVMQELIAPTQFTLDIYGGEKEHQKPKVPTGSLERILLQGELPTIPKEEVWFAVDPISGGCAVLTSEVNLLVSNNGRAEKISDVTGLGDEILDPWGASI